MATTDQQGMDAETRAALEAIDAREITVYYEDAYSTTRRPEGRMRCPSAERFPVVDRLIRRSRLARVSRAWRPVVVGSRVDAVANVILTIKGRKALTEARAGEQVGDEKLGRELHKVLTELEMTSCGKTASLDGNGGGAFASAPPKSGDFDPPHVRYRREWEAIRGRAQWRAGLASDDLARHAVVKRAEGEMEALLMRAKDELDAILHSRAHEGSEIEEERTRRMLKDGETFSAAEVAHRFRTSEAVVKRTRLRHGRTPEHGLVDPMRPMPDATPAERRERALLLYTEHRMSYRAIALRLGVSHETIRQDVMKAMAAATMRRAA